jgi:hypothetical protein
MRLNRPVFPVRRFIAFLKTLAFVQIAGRKIIIRSNTLLQSKIFALIYAGNPTTEPVDILFIQASFP